MAPLPRRSRPAGSSGFTLIELMIVVAILAILATVAIPKFSQLVRKSNEGSTKAKLATLRSALNIYQASNDGSYPADLSPLQSPGNQYLSAFPPATTATHGTRTSVDYPAAYDNTLDGGGWGYVGTGSDAGKIWVECTHTDLTGKKWTDY